MPFFTVVDLLSLFTAVLIYNMLFYYLTRMIVSPHFAQILWRRDIAPSLGKEETRIYLKLAGSVKRAATSVVHTL
ncbi:hypothetical protein KZ770_12205 [Escherichia coli]|nr:hypothetical protein [Escherichia coli]